MTGKRLYLRGSTTDPKEADRIMTRLCAQVDEQRHAKTNATFRAAMELWLRTHEIEASTRESYESYARLHFYPVFGNEPAGRINAQMLEELYAELRRCSARKPRPPASQPDPPMVEQAARIAEAAWEEDPAWGTLV